MTPTIEPLYAVAIFMLITSIGQTLFASILLVMSRRGQIIANLFLAAFMLSLCLCLCMYLLFDFWRVYLPHTTLIYQPMVFVLPPLLWFYLKFLTQPKTKLRGQELLVHALPALTVAVLLAPFYQLPGIEKIEWVYLAHDPYIRLTDVQLWLNKIINWIYAAAILQGMCYIATAWKLIRKHQLHIQQEFSFTENIDLSWLNYLLASCALIYSFVALTLLLDLLSINSSILWVSSFCLGCALLSVFGYFGVRQEVIFPEVKESTQDHRKELVSISFSEQGLVQKYKSSILSEENLQECYQELLTYMKVNRPYTNAELSISALASTMRLPSRELSRVINEKAGKNFMEFINGYRIERAKQLLLESADSKVLDIAMEVGFHSKSAFYQAFRKITNTTPMNFRQQNREQVSKD